MIYLCWNDNYYYKQILCVATKLRSVELVAIGGSPVHLKPTKESPLWPVGVRWGTLRCLSQSLENSSKRWERRWGKSFWTSHLWWRRRECMREFFGQVPHDVYIGDAVTESYWGRIMIVIDSGDVSDLVPMNLFCYGLSVSGSTCKSDLCRSSLKSHGWGSVSRSAYTLSRHRIPYGEIVIQLIDRECWIDRLQISRPLRIVGAEIGRCSDTAPGWCEPSGRSG